MALKLQHPYAIRTGAKMTLFLIIFMAVIWTPSKTLGSEPKKTEHPLKKNSGGYTQELLRLAWEISNEDKTFILILQGESGFNPWATGALGEKTLCQLLPQYHKEFIYSWKYQVEYLQIKYCYDVYKDAVKKNRLETTFYGLYRKGVGENIVWR